MIPCVDALYVSCANSVAEVAAAIGDTVGVPLELHDSSYYGGDYYRAGDGPDQVIVLENYMEDDGQSFFSTLPVGAICVQVSGFGAARDGFAQIPELHLVRAA